MPAYVKSSAERTVEVEQRSRFLKGAVAVPQPAKRLAWSTVRVADQIAPCGTGVTVVVPAAVLPVTASDHAPVPSALVARTRAW